MLPDLIRAFGRTLAQTEWLSPPKLRMYQEPLVGKLLQHARATTGFYRDRLDFDLASPEAVARAWSAIPILTRREAIISRDRLASRFVPPEAGATHEGVTSGSTGQPFPYRRSEIALVAGQALNERMLRWWKVDGSKPYARISFDRQRIAPPPEGATLSGWHSAHPQAPQYVLATAADVKIQVRWLVARKPTYLASYPSLLKELALAFRKSGTALELELLLSFGMVVDDETRQLCRKAFGAEIADTYGAEEAGHIAAQCPQCDEYHVSAETMLVEVLRDDGTPARTGEIGRVIVTSLYNYAQPLIRYEIGDLAEVGSARARCRRGLPSLRRILGRYRNVFRFADGKIASPSAGQFRLRELMPLEQVQIIQLDVDRIEIRWVPDGTERPIDLAAITERVSTVLRHPVTVSLQQVPSVERSPSGKFEDCISLVPAG